jgi:signal transduction histidine kinase
MNLSPEALEIVSVIKQSVLTEVRLISDLLDISRITHGKLELQMKPINLHQIIKHAVSVTESDFKEKGQTLEFKVDASHTALVGDADRLSQVFWNLLKNASKFTPDGGLIKITSRNEGPNAVIEVSDCGAGFPPGVGERIFDAFSQLGERATRNLGGLGLGLAIAKAVVLAHSGEIQASSAGEGKGATFTVRLPTS